MCDLFEGVVGSKTRVVADGVAYAPHLPIDVKAWGIDWYGFSVYKTWGPHMAALYGSHAAFEELKASHFQTGPSAINSWLQSVFKSTYLPWSDPFAIPAT